MNFQLAVNQSIASSKPFSRQSSIPLTGTALRAGAQCKKNNTAEDKCAKCNVNDKHSVVFFLNDYNSIRLNDDWRLQFHIYCRKNDAFFAKIWHCLVGLYVWIKFAAAKFNNLL